MDWCLNIYGEWRAAKLADRLLRFLVVAAAACLMLMWNSDSAEISPETDGAGTRPGAAASAETVAAPVASVTALLRDIPEAPALQTVPEAEADAPERVAAVSETAPDAVPVIIPDMSGNAADVPGIIPDMPGNAADIPEIVPDTPGNAADVPEIVPDTPGNAVDIPETAPDIPGDVTDVPEDIPADVPGTSEEPDHSAGSAGGFLVDEYGMICGVEDPEAVVSGGLMRLPSEGCTGIRRGAFSAGLPAAREVLIPANIVSVEAGAFAGLENVEWYTVEPGGCYTENMGVLLSGDGTCILAFPPGRLGNYKVPAGITSFAEYAFQDARITTLDITACGIEDVSGLPEHIRLLQRGSSSDGRPEADATEAY